MKVLSTNYLTLIYLFSNSKNLSIALVTVKYMEIYSILQNIHTFTQNIYFYINHNFSIQIDVFSL